MADLKMDGSFYAHGRFVARYPFQTPDGIRMGYRVCKLEMGVSEAAAGEIADVLNAALVAGADI